MRQTFRLFAAVKPVTPAGPRHLRPGLPTGLTGIMTQRAPRSSLLYLYNRTLDKLQQVPETSLYRRSVEGLTKHRLSVIEAVVPEGWEEWSKRSSAFLKEKQQEMADLARWEQEASVQQQQELKNEINKTERFTETYGISSKEIKKRWEEEMKEQRETHKDAFVAKEGLFMLDGQPARIVEAGGKVYLMRMDQQEMDPDEVEWDGDTAPPALEGSRTLEERADEAVVMDADRYVRLKNVEGWEHEPELTVEQVAEIENKIGSGLIEELIQVAEGELKLVDVMVQSKA